jgi:hypothetical protein
VTLTNLSNNDLLMYSSSANRWVNVSQSAITDGGNFLVFLALVCASQGGF